MIGGLWNGITGLNTFEKALSIESNNATNVSTVGYKEDIVNFADLMYSDSISKQRGHGSTIQSVTKAMDQQGGIKITNNPYDVAIEGRGYFIIEENNQQYNTQEERINNLNYTRAGNFKIDVNGILKTQGDLNVLGLGNIKTQNSTNNDISFNNSYTNFISSQSIGTIDNLITINSKATDYNELATNDDIANSGTNYKTKSAKINDVDILISDYRNRLKDYSLSPTSTSIESIAQSTNVTFSNYSDLLQNEDSVVKIKLDGNEISQNLVYTLASRDFRTEFYSQLTPAQQALYGDPSGSLTQNQRELYNIEASKIPTMKAFSDKISNISGITSSIDTNSGVLNITSLLPGKEVKINDAYINNELFDNQIVDVQSYVLGSGIAMVNSSRDALKTAMQNANANFLEITNTVSLENENTNSISNLSTLQLNLSNLEISSTSIGNVEITDGIIYVLDGENKFLAGKLQTAAFINEQGLLSEGGNSYKASSETGKVYNAVNLNKLVGTSLEESKANLANSLTALLIYQKAFEANSKSITTADDMLSTAIQLKR